MTTPIICWLPGWASDFSLWKGLIESRYPNAIHRLVPYSKMLLHRDCLETLPELQGVSLVIGWSLGSLLAFQTAPRLPKGVPLLAICPVGWFCHPELGWAPRVVLRMANKLLQDPRAVLTSFAEQMGPAPAEEKSAWIAQALQIPIPDLVLGLEILATPSVNHLQRLAQDRNISLLCGNQDPVVSPDLSLWLKGEIRPQSFCLSEGMSHWPFSVKWTIAQGELLHLPQ